MEAIELFISGVICVCVDRFNWVAGLLFPVGSLNWFSCHIAREYHCWRLVIMIMPFSSFEGPLWRLPSFLYYSSKFQNLYRSMWSSACPPHLEWLLENLTKPDSLPFPSIQNHKNFYYPLKESLGLLVNYDSSVSNRLDNKNKIS